MTPLVRLAVTLKRHNKSVAPELRPVGFLFFEHPPAATR
jgi:hypothetical protein